MRYGTNCELGHLAAVSKTVNPSILLLMVWIDQIYAAICCSVQLILLLDKDHNFLNDLTFPFFVPYTIPCPGIGWNCATLT